MNLIALYRRIRRKISAASVARTHGKHGENAEREHKRDALNQNLHVGNLDPSR